MTVDAAAPKADDARKEQTHPCPLHLVGLAQPTDERPATVSPQHWATLLDAGWAGRLRAPDGRTRFRIRYYGELLDGLIVDGEAPALAYAVTESGEHILLFDAGSHGYNALLCDLHDPQELSARQADQWYVDADGQDTFDILVWAGFNIDWDEERAEHIDPDDPGMVPTVDGRRLPFEAAKQAGFDAFYVVVTNVHGRATDVIQEELA